MQTIMSRKEFLEYLDQQRLSINSHKLRRYIRFRLICPMKRSFGKNGGVNTEFTLNMVDVLREVESLQCNPYIEHDRELLFVLFAKGCPVNYEKLKEYFIENFYLVLDAYKTAAETYHQDPGAFLYEFIQPMVENHLPKRKPGKPSKLDDVKRQEKIKQETARTLMSFTL